MIRFYYWFAFPALLPIEPYLVAKIQAFSDFTSVKKDSCTLAYKKFIAEQPKYSDFFLVSHVNDGFQFAPLSDYKSNSQFMFGFKDPSILDANPGWPLRNFLMFIRYTFKLDRATIICYRETSNSIVIETILTDIPGLKIFYVRFVSQVCWLGKRTAW